ncbi:Ku protein [Paludicola sp. MB14-C6]|uniref:non-homologous end joining protein Ku n=1 Tax=Paludihabitans sp. MB14-C6 TaxID=3070656 RepID=UPI0027DB06D3|nr:Ku protein [Paludicola sp. MB14-C6]WMJ24347.1 Ku protein [Paludicola sp. MB14-C6]
MAVANKTTIAFSLVSIPIAMYTANQDNDISFNQLHKEDNSRIKYKKTCGHCGKEITSQDIVKGYQYDDDKYVVVTEDDLEKIKTEKDKTIQILHFANLNQISPVYYDKTYHAIPEAGGDKAFELLRSALMAEQKIAIGKTVIGNHETLLAIIPREDGMLIQTMYYNDDIKDVPKTYNKPEISDTELQMAKTLIQSMDTPFNPEEYKDEYQIKLRELLEQKIAGKEIVQAKPEEQGKIIDIMEALQASIEKNTKTKPIKRTRKSKGVS